MLDEEALQRLKGKKNLLAFSGGVDSTALYHLLEKNGIAFDIAFVNYGIRAQSEEEEAYAKALAARDGKRVFVRRCTIEAGDFEHKARIARYRFFEEVIKEGNYTNLITAHQLDDMLEWLLMQLCKGAGCVELVGMESVEDREGFTLVRPLLYTPKEALVRYLESASIRYFIDESNLSDRHTRNRFRKEAASFLMQECADGIARSFRYLKKDKEALLPEAEVLFSKERLTLLKRPENDLKSIRLIDRELKKKGYILSAAQKEEILKNRSVVVGGEWAVDMSPKRIWIAPYRETVMPKAFKERCRRCGVAPKVRPYIFEEGFAEELFSLLGC